MVSKSRNAGKSPLWLEGLQALTVHLKCSVPQHLYSITATTCEISNRKSSHHHWQYGKFMVVTWGEACLKIIWIFAVHMHNKEFQKPRSLPGLAEGIENGRITIPNFGKKLGAEKRQLLKKFRGPYYFRDCQKVISCHISYPVNNFFQQNDFWSKSLITCFSIFTKVINAHSFLNHIGLQ